jgi:hypothetical protein
MDREKALEIIEKLDNYAREIDCYEYGLPTFQDEREAMVDIVMSCFKGAKNTEQANQPDSHIIPGRVLPCNRTAFV